MHQGRLRVVTQRSRLRWTMARLFSTESSHLATENVVVACEVAKTEDDAFEELGRW